MKIDLSRSFLLKSGEASANEKVLLWIGVHGNSLISLLVVIFLLFNKTEIGLFLFFSISTIYPFKLSNAFNVNLSFS